MPPTESADPTPDQVDTHEVKTTGGTTETTDKHDEASKPEVHTEKTTVETKD